MTTPGRGLLALLSVVLVVWFLAVLIAGWAHMFQAPPSTPPLAVLIAVVAPLAVFAVAYRASPVFRDFVLGFDLRLLTAFQAWRVIGGMFLVLYALGLLPGLFAWPAGVGDVAVGVAAPFVLMAIIHGAASWPRQVAWLNVAGLLDFVGAVGTGALVSSTTLRASAETAARAELGALPLSLIPTFLVPLWTLFHLASLLQLRRLGRHQAGSDRPRFERREQRAAS